MAEYTIAAKETRYNSILFRSRLEARYALMFDILGIQYQYEPEKFDTPTGPYIPDFWIASIGDWDYDPLKCRGSYWEIKGPVPDATDLSKTRYLSLGSGKEVYIFGPELTVSWLDSNSILGSGYDYEQQHLINQCPICGMVGVSGRYVNDETSGPWFTDTFHHFCIETILLCKKWNSLDYFLQDATPFSDTPLINLAVAAAKSARFEDPAWRSEIQGTIAAGKHLRTNKTFCNFEQMQVVFELLKQWAQDGPDFSPPGWYKHLMEKRGEVWAHGR